MAYVDFIQSVHSSTKRDYLKRVNDFDKATVSEVAIRFDKDYWDGERQYGYGGYLYDGRWRKVAEAMAAHYKLPKNARILDVGCGKGFLLYEFTQVLPECDVVGLDISAYAVENAKEEVKPFLQVGHANSLPFADKSFDFVVSITTLHNLYNFDLHAALKEIERVRKGSAHVNVESYRNEREKMNLLYWQMTCRAFHAPAEWEWIFEQAGYNGDHSFIFFE
jgi:ubiquinone/menaquinone biosynthesis C-methylase UbiE